MTEDEKATFLSAIHVWGREGQIDMLLEEMGELIVAIQHNRRGRCTTEKILDELSDVGIMVDQVSLMMEGFDYEGSRSKYLRYRTMKVNRLKDRVTATKAK